MKINKKVLSPVLAILIFIGGGLTTRLYDRVKAESWSGLVGSINGTSPDADGNVNVVTLNNRTINSNVPNTADFAQYDANTSDIAEIQTALTGLTATPENVASGYTFVGDGGNIATGTLNTSSGEMENVFYQGPTWNGSSYTFSQDCSFAAISAAAGKQNGSGLSLGISISGTYTLVSDTGYQDLNGGNGQGGRYRSMFIKDIKAGTVVSFSGFFQYAANVYILS